MSDIAHTPTPYHVGKESDDGVYGILVSSGHAIGLMLTEEDAAFVVRATNAHDGLVEALTLLHEFVGAKCSIGGQREQHELLGIFGKTRAALKAAGVAP